MTILVVDDNEQNLYQLQVLLGGSGYQVVAAANGAEALSRARQDAPDLVVSDILMPVMDGFSLCREWKQDDHLKGIPFVFYTATYTDEGDRDLALSLGAERFLVKPEEPEVLLQTIREVAGPAGHSRTVGPSTAATPADPPTEAPITEDAVFLKQYNAVLIHKLERKLEQLEQTNRAMEVEIAERRQAEARIVDQLDELRRWHQATLGREGRVLELKKEVNELLSQFGQPPRYPSALDGGEP